jgi:MoaA/NifB/PqqE/SkfB family radical SAM enzyme
LPLSAPYGWLMPGEISADYPGRVIFNFTDRCNMLCPYCYVPWDRLPVDEETAYRVVEQLAEWAPRSLTVGGGDPLIYPWTPDLLALLREQLPAAKLQLDTNGLKLDRELLLRLLPLVDLLGLPLDAVSRAGSQAMRSHPSHFAKVLALLDLTQELRVPTKVNTVVSRKNVEEIPQVGAAIARAGVSRWSLYEFWRVGPDATRNAADYELPNSVYRQVVADAVARFPELVIEQTGSVADRHDAYLFCTPTGRAYSISPDGHENVELGNLLRDPEAVLAGWRRLSDPAKTLARAGQRFELAEARDG